jgi:four helix bundle protein
MFNFEKLDVWQKAIEFADFIYSETRRFPNEERFGLTNQMRRAAVSISSNIAEGSSRMSQIDFARFIEIGTGSVFEVVSQASYCEEAELSRRKRFTSSMSLLKIESHAQWIAAVPTLNSQLSTMNFRLRVWRQKDRQSRGKLVVYEARDISPNTSFLEMLDIVNENLLARW